MAGPAGQSLFDSLAGSFGHGVDRNQLNAFVANSQTTNGLRSAQTEEALNNARAQREEMQANDDLESSITGTLGDDGKPLVTPSAAHMVATELKAHYGNAQQVMAALGEAQKVHNTGIISNAATLNTPEATAALAGNTNKAPEAVAVPNEYSVPAGMTPPVVNQTPLGAAETASYGANANLHNAQATHPDAFHRGMAPNLTPEQQEDMANFIRQNPNLAGNFRSLMPGAAIISSMMHPGGGSQPPAQGTAPPNGQTPPIHTTATIPSPDGTAQIPPNGITPAAGVSLKEQADIRKDFASGTAAKQTTALNTMIQHSILFDKVADQLQNGNFTPGNDIKNMWQRVFGSSAPSNLNLVGGFLGREAVRATVNAGAGTGQERELGVNDDASPKTMHDAANLLRSLAAGQAHSLDLRARRGGVDIRQLLGPEARAAYGMGDTNSAPPPAGGMTSAPSSGAPISLDDYLKSQGH